MATCVFGDEVLQSYGSWLDILSVSLQVLFIFLLLS